MNRGTRRRLTDVGLVAGSLGFVLLGWYAYFVLKRADLPSVVFGTLFFGSGAVIGIISLTVKQYHSQHALILDPCRLGKSQNLMIGLVALIWAACGVWLVFSERISVFLQETFGRGLPYLLIKLVFVVGFFYFAWQGFLRFKQALFGIGIGESGNRG